MLERQSPQQMVLGKLSSYMLKNEIRSLFNSIQKLSSKLVKDLKVRIDT